MKATSKSQKAKKFLCIAIVLMLVSMIGASVVQSSGGSVKVSHVTWVDTDGVTKAGLLLAPKSATAEKPAPAVVCSHGFLNNKEMQDLNYVELARRGYVVLAIDMASHGDSDIMPSVMNMMPSVWQGVLFLADIPYVDNTRIGVTGHSFGGFSCNYSVTMDNMTGRNLVAAVLVNSMDPTFDGDGDGVFDNVYGSRDVGVVAGEYDEFAFNIVDANGNKQPKPAFIHSAEAQSFLNFGQSASGQERVANTVYTQNIDGKEAMRVIYTHGIIHPWSHFSGRSTKATIEFFDKALGAPNPIASTNQVWQIKVFFNALGIVGLLMFAVNCAILLAAKPIFKGVSRLGDEAVMTPPAYKGKGWWFWASLGLGALFGTVVYLPIMTGTKSPTYQPTFLNQAAVRGVCTWALCCGVFTIILFVISKVINKDAPVDKDATGITISPVNIVKTVALAISVVALSYIWVFIADYFFQVDFRIWVLAFKRFNPQFILIALPFMLMSAVFYIASSISINCYNYRTIGGKEWINTAVLAAAVALPAYLLCAIQYFYFFGTGYLLFANNENPIMIVWLFPLLSVLPISVVISRKLYKATGNPYLGGIVNAILVALISSINTCTFMA